ncbi:probable serine/threonine-protein kinase kinX isoform X1 [Drosophila takahashii]|uniref:probable serine/threonine-protein kinase kinX isoform X1 n=1 Tax=Drosophila takahashii TaxID=29030 RepID=UPI001CF8BCC5|nr:uncharacterized protein LOC123002335 [Drosophila takahashii]
MGGTKCCFRDCRVNSGRNPSMHFFKFPAKDPSRLKDWVKNCANPDISNASTTKLSTRTVCARHFRAESFMNYKMDRLIPKQTPTLLRINRDLALDFGNLDQNGEALLVKLKPPTQPHLIPPKDFECPLGFVDGDGEDHDDDDGGQRLEKPQETQTEAEEQPPSEDEAPEIDLLINSEQEQSPVAKEKAAVPQNILDIMSQLQPSLGIKLIQRPVEIQRMAANEEQTAKEQTGDSTKRQMVTNEAETSSNKPEIRKLEEEKQPTKDQAKRRKIQEQKTENPVQIGKNLQENVKRQTQKAPQLEKPTQSSHFKQNPSQEKPTVHSESPGFLNDEENMDSQSSSDSEPTEKPSSSEDALHEKLLQDYNKLQAEFDRLSEENAKLKRLQAEQPKAPKPASNSLGKPQLYMAIKKYLGPTMAALLRMEMFGGSEDRTWKDDEREFATELLQLGDEVYKYCCDEWRFRLPSLRTARSWLEKKKTDNADEFLDL